MVRNLFFLLLLLCLASGCAQLRKTYPVIFTGAGAAIGGLGGPAPAATGAVIGLSVGNELSKDPGEAENVTESPTVLIPGVTGGVTESDVQELAQALIQQQLSSAQQSWGDKIMEQVWGIIRLLFWVCLGLGILFIVIIPFLHKHGIKKVLTTLQAEVHEEIEEKLKKVTR